MSVGWVRGVSPVTRPTQTLRIVRLNAKTCIIEGSARGPPYRSNRRLRVRVLSWGMYGTYPSENECTPRLLRLAAIPI